MKRFTVIVAMLALMLASVATANAAFLTDPSTGATVTTWSNEGIGLQGNRTHLSHNTSSIATSGTVTFSAEGTDAYNVTMSQTMRFGQVVAGTELTYSPSSNHVWFIANKTAVGRNQSAFDAKVVAVPSGVFPADLAAQYGFLKQVPDGKMIVMGARAELNSSRAGVANGTVLNLLAQTKNATSNLLAGKWRLFGFVDHNKTATQTGNQNNTMIYDIIMADLIFNASQMASQSSINATLYYRTFTDGVLGGVTADTATATINSDGKVTMSGDYGYFDGAVLDASGNTLFCSTNTTGTLYNAQSMNSTAMMIAVRVDDDTQGTFANFNPKKYAIFAAGGQELLTGAAQGGSGNYSHMGVLGSLDMATTSTWNGDGANFTAWNNTGLLFRPTGSGHVGNGSFLYGSMAMKNSPISSARIRTQVNTPLNGANFTGAMRLDGNLYVGLMTRGATFAALTVIVPASSDAVENLSTLSSDFVTDAQLLAATGLNLCPRANTTQGGSCFELSHFNYPTTGDNARQVEDIAVSTYVGSVIQAAQNASVMNSKMFNATEKADSADYNGTFTSENYAGAPVELKSMYAFNGTSFQLQNASNDVQLLAKWVFVANGTGNIGNVAGLTAEQADPWKYMKKYTKAKNATAYTKVYGNGTHQSWDRFWDADGTTTVKLSDGVVFYTQYGTNSSQLMPLKKDDTFAAGSTYVLWAVLANGGMFDLDNSTDFVFDPPRIITDETIVISSSSSSGCVFNPVAGFGLEWLLLLLAPAVGIIRNRFRK